MRCFACVAMIDSFECFSLADERRSESSVPIRFYLHDKESFEHLAQQEGFAIDSMWTTTTEATSNRRIAPL